MAKTEECYCHWLHGSKKTHGESGHQHSGPILPSSFVFVMAPNISLTSAQSTFVSFVGGLRGLGLIMEKDMTMTASNTNALLGHAWTGFYEMENLSQRETVQRLQEANIQKGRRIGELLPTERHGWGVGLSTWWVVSGSESSKGS